MIEHLLCCKHTVYEGLTGWPGQLMTELKFFWVKYIFKPFLSDNITIIIVTFHACYVCTFTLFCPIFSLSAGRCLLAASTANHFWCHDVLPICWCASCIYGLDLTVCGVRQVSVPRAPTRPVVSGYCHLFLRLTHFVQSCFVTWALIYI